MTRHGITLPETEDTRKQWLTCLGCDAPMLTDRCHRRCDKCRRRIAATPVGRPAHRLSLPVGARHTVAPPDAYGPLGEL